MIAAVVVLDLALGAAPLSAFIIGIAAVVVLDLALGAAPLSAFILGITALHRSEVMIRDTYFPTSWLRFSRKGPVR